MNRQDAVNVTKEFFAMCGVAGGGIILMPPDSDDVLSKGYQIHVKSAITPEISDCIHFIVSKHHLAIKSEGIKNFSIIYKPPTDVL